MVVKLVPTTREYLDVTVVAQEDISDSTVEVADMADDAIPTDSDWHPPADLKRPNSRTFVAKIFVETGRSETVRTVWVAIGDRPERPVRRAGAYIVA